MRRLLALFVALPLIAKAEPKVVVDGSYTVTISDRDSMIAECRTQRPNCVVDSLITAAHFPSAIVYGTRREVVLYHVEGANRLTAADDVRTLLAKQQLAPASADDLLAFVTFWRVVPADKNPDSTKRWKMFQVSACGTTWIPSADGMNNPNKFAVQFTFQSDPKDHVSEGEGWRGGTMKVFVASQVGEYCGIEPGLIDNQATGLKGMFMSLAVRTK